MYLRILFILALSYAATSFQVSRHRSIVVAKPQIAADSSLIASSVFFKKLNLSLIEEVDYHIDLGQDYTSIKITTSAHSSVQLAFCSENDTIDFGTLYSNDVVEMPPSFRVFSSPTRYITLQSNGYTSIEIELFYAPPVQLQLPTNLKNKSNCTKPPTIPQNEWRRGLPPPKSGRKTTRVKHCIVHHSAGSNTDTNYVNTIRNIYLFHTESNGWDDIGYNFVIAPNGTIFSARDPQNEGDEDNIQGAHFCAKNGGTMGICLLGNYNLTSPTADMQNSLKDLLAWKLKKEELNTTQYFPHPDALGDNLSTISMHRTGCPTECPGDSVAILLNTIASETQEIIDQCNDVVAVSKPIQKYKQRIYPNPSNGRFYVMIEAEANIDTYAIKDMNGKRIFKSNFPANGFIKTDLYSGMYLIELYSNEVPISSQKIIIR